ncbi:hypothetical protein UZ38_39890, partial [Bacillus amyloliquefaciens]
MSAYARLPDFRERKNHGTVGDDAMQIIQRVTVMQVLTENSKKKLLASFEERKEILERECNQLYFQL